MVVDAKETSRSTLILENPLELIVAGAMFGGTVAPGATTKVGEITTVGKITTVGATIVVGDAIVSSSMGTVNKGANSPGGDGGSEPHQPEGMEPTET